MAVQTVVIDVFQTNKKLKEFDKNVDRLGKSLEKMQKQMERLNQEKRSTGLSQGDTLMKSLDKMTSTMTRLFSNGIKLNNPTVTAKVTVDFSKMNLAGQMGVALKNADIAGMIIRNLPRSRMTMPEMKIDMPKSMKVEMINEAQVKPSKNKNSKNGILSNTKGLWNNVQQKVKGSMGLKTKSENLWKTILEGAEAAEKARNAELKQRKREEFRKSSKSNGKLKSTAYERRSGKLKNGTSNLNRNLDKPQKNGKLNKISEKLGKFTEGLGKRIFNNDMGDNIVDRTFEKIGKSIINKSTPGKMLGFTVGGYSMAIGAFVGTIKAAAGAVQAVVGVFQKVVGVLSSVWGQIQKWAVDPLVQAQNQISQNKGYWGILGGQKKAEKFDNEIFEMSEKSPFSHEAIDSSARILLNNGLSADRTKEILSLSQDTAAAQSLDDSGFQNIVTTISQLSSRKTVYIEDITQGLGNTIPALKLITQGISGEAEATEEGMAKVKEAIENGEYDGSKIVEALLKGMEQNTGIAEEIAATTYMGLQTKIKNIFQSNIVRKWGTGLSEGLTEGLSGFANWLDANKSKFAQWGDTLKRIGKEIGEAITNTLQDLGDRMSRVFSSQEFKTANLSDKIVIIWDEVIAGPFSEWWASTGRQFFQNAFTAVGDTVGGVISGIIKGFLGIEPDSALSEGANLGISFAKGFLNGFDAGSVGISLLKALGEWLIVSPIKLFVDVVKRTVTAISEEQEDKPPTEYEKQYGDKVKLPPWWSTSLIEVSEGTKLPMESDDPITMEMYNEQKAKKEKEQQEASDKWEQQNAINLRGESLQTAENIRLMKDGIPLSEEKNKLTKELLKQANDLEWEIKAGIHTDEERLGLQQELNDTKQKLQDLYPGLFRSEDLYAEKMKNILGIQMQINKEKEKSRMYDLEKELKEMEPEIKEQKIQAGKDRKEVVKYKEELEEIDKKSEGLVRSLLGADLYRLKAQNAYSEGETETGDKLSALADKIEQKDIEKMKGLGFTEEEIKGAMITDETGESHLTGEGAETLIGDKREGITSNLDEAEKNLEASSASIKAYNQMQIEFLKSDIKTKTDYDADYLKNNMDTVYQNPKGTKVTERDFVIETFAKIDELEKEIQSYDPTSLEFGLGLSNEEEFIESIKNIPGIGEPLSIAVAASINLVRQKELIESIKSLPLIGGSLSVAVSAALGNFNEQNAAPMEPQAKGNIWTSPHIGLVAEAGPEAIIPLAGAHKSRGISLWEQAGHMLGVLPAHAEGGMFGNFAEPKQTPHLYRQIEETAKETETKMSMPPQIQTGDMNFNFTFHGTDTNSQEEIMKVIKAQMPEIADEIAGTIAVNIQRIFANMQLQTG